MRHRLLLDQRLSNLMVVEQERFLHILQRKVTEKNYEGSGKEDDWSDAAWLNLWDDNISFNYLSY